jgi:hypothetical protein
MTQVVDETSLINQKFTFTSFTNGWVLGPHSELLFWVPPENRVNFTLFPRALAVLGQPWTKLDLNQYVHGISWQKCQKLGSPIDES